MESVMRMKFPGVPTSTQTINPNATDNTFECAYLGCTYFVALNYAPTANVDDGTCSFSIANPCPTDINGDGITAASDILEMLGQYGTECQY